MKNFFSDRVRSEDGAETVEIIIGIVVFGVFGIAVFGMITNVAGNKMQDVSRCLGASQDIISNGRSNASNNNCKKYNAGEKAGNAANYNGNAS